MKNQIPVITEIVKKYRKPSAQTFNMIVELSTGKAVELVIKKYLKPVPATFNMIAELQALLQPKYRAVDDFGNPTLDNSMGLLNLVDDLNNK